jgi:hypothetical protein
MNQGSEPETRLAEIEAREAAAKRECAAAGGGPRRNPYARMNLALATVDAIIPACGVATADTAESPYSCGHSPDRE